VLQVLAAWVAVAAAELGSLLAVWATKAEAKLLAGAVAVDFGAMMHP